jgi:Spy/CpxP family protein refolding chaperone
MSQRPMHAWSLAPVFLLAGMIWIGNAHAQGHAPAPDDSDDADIEMEFEFDGSDFEVDTEDFDLDVERGHWIAGGDRSFRGPGGLSGPAPRDGDRMQGHEGNRRMHRRMIVRRGGPASGHGGGTMHRGRGGMRGMGGMGGMGGGHAALGRHLELTERQQEQMTELHESAQRKMIAVRAGLAEAKLDLQKLMRADAPDRAKIDATIDRMAKLRADAQKARLGTRLEAHTILTPEQRAKMKEMRGGHGGQRGPGEHGRPGGSHPGGTHESPGHKRGT